VCVYFLQKLSYVLYMSSQNLIIYKFNSLYHILEELDLDLNFIIIYIDTENSLNDLVNKLNNYLIVSNKKNLNFSNQIILDSLPMNIHKLLEKINIEFLKLQFSNQSKMNVKKYAVDFNSREMLFNNIKLKLTEKEINTISYLAKATKPVSINELEKNVWRYQPDIETHTVETHIYRLRKKILTAFDDDDFIISKKNGYQIK
tara:strand:- start:811 stop:1416 length:606 start_codon:yes stop_codon:yes gene_type:complete